MTGPKGVCLHCGKIVEATEKAAYAVTGYEIERKGGGQNHVYARTRVDGQIWHERFDGDCLDRFLRQQAQAGEQLAL